MTLASASPHADRARLLEAQTVAADFFTRQLRSRPGDGPRAYLYGRGFDSAVDSPMWTVGYAPAGWTALTDHLRGKGFDDSEILASGLGLTTRRHTVVDRFRDRITFGVRDETGDLVAFIARAAPGAGDVPKYLNSPQSSIYDKGAVIFGLGDQRSRLASGGVPVLVEGPLDAMAVALASAADRPPFVGLAPCGTALTSTQVSALARATTRPVLVAFDGDSAGAAAAVRAHGHLAHRMPPARAVRLPAGADPASVLAEQGISGLRAALGTTTPLSDVVVDEVLTQYASRMANAEARLSALRQLAPSVAAFPSSDVARQSARLSALLDLDHQTVTRELVEAATAARARPQFDADRSCAQPARVVGARRTQTAVLKETRTVGGRTR